MAWSHGHSLPPSTAPNCAEDRGEGQGRILVNLKAERKGRHHGWGMEDA